MKTILISCALLAGCGFVEIDAEIRSSCATRHGVEIPAVPDAVAPSEIELDVDLVLQDLDALVELDADLRFTHVRAIATSGIDDLGFVRAALFTLASGDPDVPLPTAMIADCSDDCDHDGAGLLLRAETDADVLDYAASGAVVLGTTLAGELPRAAWTIDLEVCAEGTASASL